MMCVHYGSRARRGEGSLPHPAAAGFSEPIAYVDEGVELCRSASGRLHGAGTRALPVMGNH
jgi:hypothetical protein